jgi:hypothetical protein
MWLSKGKKKSFESGVVDFYRLGKEIQNCVASVIGADDTEDFRFREYVGVKKLSCCSQGT